jgi:hypothetical protein
MPCTLRWLVPEGTKANAKSIFSLTKIQNLLFQIGGLIF